jgi:hypothetical protein
VAVVLDRHARFVAGHGSVEGVGREELRSIVVGGEVLVRVGDEVPRVDRSLRPACGAGA